MATEPLLGVVSHEQTPIWIQTGGADDRHRDHRLTSVAIPIYSRSIVRGKERVLKNNLFTLRTVIHEYTWDKQKAPQTLNDLVSDRYLRQIPVDPITDKADWKIIMDPSNTVNQSEPGIFDIRSSSDKISLEATPYSAW